MNNFGCFPCNLFADALHKVRDTIFDHDRVKTRARRFSILTRSGQAITFAPGVTMPRCTGYGKIGKNGGFKGYELLFKEASNWNIEIFLPKQNSGYFEHPYTDLSGKFIVFDIAKITHIEHKRKLKIIADARPPLEKVLRQQRRALEDRRTVFWSLSVDHDLENLIFPLEGGGQLLVNLKEAQNFANRYGYDEMPNALTGLYWKLRVTEDRYGDIWASPIDINTKLN